MTAMNKKPCILIVYLMMMLSLISCSHDDNSAMLTPLTQSSVILAYGDSLTFGTGAGDPKTQSYAAVLQQLTGIKVVNAGVPGEVTASALKRLPAVLRDIKPDLVILCHGGNDLIRRLGNEQIKSNLDKMIALIKASGAEVVLVGVPGFNLALQVPDLYPELATLYDVPVDVMILPSVLGNAKLKSDQVHPNAAGYRLIASSVHKLLTNSGAL